MFAHRKDGLPEYFKVIGLVSKASSFCREYDCHRLVLDLENFFIRTLNQRNLPERYEIGEMGENFHSIPPLYFSVTYSLSNCY